MAGVAGVWTMTQFTKLWNALLPRFSGDDPLRPPVPYSRQEWDSTSRIAEKVGSRAFRRPLTLRETKAGAAIVHYAVGGAAGVCYAILAHRSSLIATRSGAVFGIGLWLIADEYVIPSLGLSRKLRDYSLVTQANSLGEHLIYGITTDLAYRSLCRCTDSFSPVKRMG